jgi:hypothetical protein
MGRNKHQRLARLEQTAQRLRDERKKREADHNERLRRAAWDHLTMVVAVVLHGDPRIDERLEIAWRRTLDRLGLTETPPRDLLIKVRDILCDQLPGDSPLEKLARVLSSAPPWILSFCLCSMDAVIFKIPLQLKGPLPEQCRSEIARPSWPRLPRGAFADGGPMPEKPEDLSWLDDLLSKRGVPINAYDSLDVDEINDLLQLIEKGEENWTRLERLRRNEIMAKVRAAHPEMDPRVIARENKANNESD